MSSFRQRLSISTIEPKNYDFGKKLLLNVNEWYKCCNRLHEILKTFHSAAGGEFDIRKGEKKHEKWLLKCYVTILLTWLMHFEYKFIALGLTFKTFVTLKFDNFKRQIIDIFCTVKYDW